MCGYKTSFLKDPKNLGKKLTSANPAEYSISQMFEYISHSTRHQNTEKTANQSINLYKDLLGNRKLHFVLHIPQEIALANVQPVLNTIEKYSALYIIILAYQ